MLIVCVCCQFHLRPQMWYNILKLVESISPVSLTFLSPSAGCLYPHRVNSKPCCCTRQLHTPGLWSRPEHQHLISALPLPAAWLPLLLPMYTDSELWSPCRPVIEWPSFRPLRTAANPASHYGLKTLSESNLLFLYHDISGAQWPLLLHCHVSALHLDTFHCLHRWYYS